MTRQDVPKLTGTPRRPRRAEPPAPNRPCRPRRVSPIGRSFVQDSRVAPRVPPGILVVRVSNTRGRVIVTGGDRRVFFRVRFLRRFFFFSERASRLRRDLRRDLILPPHLPPHTE